MSVASVSHQSLAQSLLARKWGLKDDEDACTVVQSPDHVPFDSMGPKLLEDRVRFKAYVCQIVEIEAADFKTRADSRQISVGDLPLTRVTANFSPVVAATMLPVVRRHLRRIVETIPPSPPEATTPYPPPSPQRPSTPPSERTSPVGVRLTPYDDSGAALTGSTFACDLDAVIGRKHFRRNPEVLSTISRKWVRLNAVDSKWALSKLPDTCPLWYSIDDEPTRHPFKREARIDGRRLYIYHDRNDTALGHVEVVL